MKTVFIDVSTKETKEFVFKVIEHNDGSFTVIRQSSRIYPDGKKVIKSERKANCANRDELKNCELNSSRQGKMFLDSQFWINS
ncbi:hypothetical protein J4Z08_23150 [Citrobacter portucalensis]|uniref:hypothetical protein n=1 Tax=Citrobacter portucalensis TaxID=1639133 RepID=UPI003140890A